MPANGACSCCAGKSSSAPATTRARCTYSAEGRLRPVGTRFDVRQFAGRTRVAVHEGAVQVENRAGQGLLLPSGRQLDFDRERLGAPQPLPVGSGA